MEKISRAAAKTSGLIRYFTGLPCKNGHISERSVSCCACLHCKRVSPKQKLSSAANYKRNAEKIKEKRRARYRSIPYVKEFNKAVRGRRIEKAREYDRMRDKRDREKRRAVRLRWMQRDPELHRQRGIARNARARARKSGVSGDFSRPDIAKILKGQKRRCWWCRKKLGADYQMDHRIPLSRGGSNAPGNMVAACPTCNRSKGSKMPWEFSGTLF